MTNEALLWVGFNLFVVAMLALDLGVFHRKGHIVSVKEALTWTGVWIALSLIFNAFIYYRFGNEHAVQFLTGYLIEKSLSVDNIFVIILIFSYFKVPPAYQHKVLFLGILGALGMRAIFIFTGIELIHSFHWLIYLFGGFLVITGIKMLISKDTPMDLGKNMFVRMVRKGRALNGRLCRGQFLYAKGWGVAGNAVVPRVAGDRGNRSYLRGRLDPRDPRCV